MSLSIEESPVKATSVILDKSQDWDKWLAVIKRKAQTTNVWQYINPDLKIQPEMPKEPSLPSVTQVKQGATTYSDITTDQDLRVLNFLRDDYKINQRKYDQTFTALANVSNTIINSISTRNLAFIERDCETP